MKRDGGLVFGTRFLAAAGCCSTVFDQYEALECLEWSILNFPDHDCRDGEAKIRGVLANNSIEAKVGSFKGTAVLY